MNNWIVQANSQTFMIDWFLDEYMTLRPDEQDWWVVYKKHNDLIKKE